MASPVRSLRHGLSDSLNREFRACPAGIPTSGDVTWRSFPRRPQPVAEVVVRVRAELPVSCDSEVQLTELRDRDGDVSQAHAAAVELQHQPRAGQAPRSVDREPNDPSGE